MHNPESDHFVDRDDLVPGVSIDCVVFGYHNKVLHVLIMKYFDSNAWALPGGFLPKDKEMKTVASEVLADRAGVSDVFFQQLFTFDSLNRGWDCNELSQKTLSGVLNRFTPEERENLASIFKQRYVSTAYFALVNSNEVIPKPDSLSEKCEWVAVSELPPMVLDHELMVNKALERLRIQLNYLPIGRSLLNEKFTMSDFQSLYESILQRKLDRGNFQRKILKLNILIRHEKLMTGAQNKAPYLYSINNAVYDELLKSGIGFM